MSKTNYTKARYGRPGRVQASGSGQVDVYYNESWAVVVGINDYGDFHLPLYNAENDAKAVAKILKGTYKFDHVMPMYNEQATKKNITEWLLDYLPQKAQPNDRVLFFFAGHGTTRPGTRTGFLVPYGARQEKYADYINMDELRDAYVAIRAKHILFLLDCCFSGIAALATRSVARLPERLDDVVLKHITARKAYQVITAGANDDLTSDSGTRVGHSVFTGALLEALEGAADQNYDGLITGIELYNYLRSKVIQETARHGGKGQTPFFSYLPGSEQGDFLFFFGQREQPSKGVLSNHSATIIKQFLTGLAGRWTAAVTILVIILSFFWFSWSSVLAMTEPLTWAIEYFIDDVFPPGIGTAQPHEDTPLAGAFSAMSTETATPTLTPTHSIPPTKKPTIMSSSIPTQTQTPTVIPTQTPRPGPQSLQFERDTLDKLRPGQEQWYTFTNRSGDTIIFSAFSPNVNLGREQMQIYIYNQDQISGWPPQEPDKLTHYGMGEPPGQDRDGDGGTGELIWRGLAFRDTRYYLRFVNRSDSWINYCITSKDLFNESCLR